jgi:hypothetical protein
LRGRYPELTLLITNKLQLRNCIAHDLIGQDDDNYDEPKFWDSTRNKTSMNLFMSIMNIGTS